jgi:hypothetical protein
MSNINIFVRITNAFFLNLPISYAGDDFMNDCYVSSLSSSSHIELFYANLQSVDRL